MAKLFVFRGNDAKNKYEILKKEDIMEQLLTRRNLSTTKKINKTQEKDGTIIYEIALNDMGNREYYKVRFPRIYQEENLYYIDEFDSWVNNYRKYNLKRLKLAALLCFASVTGTVLTYEPINEGLETVIEKVQDLLTDEVGDLEREIQIHSGHGEIEGYSISASDDHGCVLGKDKSKSVEERISLYCEEHSIEYLEEAALQKYDYLYNNEIILGNSIDLKTLEKLEKKKLKSLQQQ